MERRELAAAASRTAFFRRVLNGCGDLSDMYSICGFAGFRDDARDDRGSVGNHRAILKL